MGYTNSPLVNHTHVSPNQSGLRNHAIDRVSIHCVVGQVSVETLGNIFAPAGKGASSNYGVGYDGRIGLYVEEKDRSWCTSSAANDNRAVTIEVASDAYHPYAVTTKAYEALIQLVADICKRNGKTKAVWFGDKAKTLAYTPQPYEMVFTVHRWFDNKSCPGDDLYSRHPDIIRRVNAILAAQNNPKKEEQDMTKEEARAIALAVVQEQQNKNDPIRYDLKDVPGYWRDEVAQLIRAGAIKGDGKHQVAKRDSQIAAMVAMKRYYEQEDPTYRTIEDVPAWGRPYVQALIDRGTLSGVGHDEDGTRILNIKLSTVRIIKMLSDPAPEQEAE